MIYQNEEKRMPFHMVQKTKKQQKISVGTFQARTDNRQIIPSGPFSQSGSQMIITAYP